MGGWRKYLELQLQAKSGLNSALVVGALIGLVSAAVTFVFLLVAAFVWLARRFDPLVYSLVLGGIFLLITIFALGYALWSQRRTAAKRVVARPQAADGSAGGQPHHWLAQDDTAACHRRSRRRRCHTAWRARATRFSVGAERTRVCTARRCDAGTAFRSGR